MLCSEDADCSGCDRLGSVPFCADGGCACTLPGRGWRVVTTVVVVLAMTTVVIVLATTMAWTSRSRAAEHASRPLAFASADQGHAVVQDEARMQPDPRDARLDGVRAGVALDDAW